MPRVMYLPPQLAEPPNSPLPYTASPWKLLWTDICLFFRCARYLPGIIFPLTPWNSGCLDELYPSLRNIVSVTLQLVLSVCQLLFLLSLPILLVWMVPTLGVLVYMVTVLFLNKGICDLFLNRGDSVLVSSVPEKEAPEHQHEHWIFINGVAVGHYWLQQSINRLGYTFGRKVTGVHNPTAGLIFDIIQCLVQRNFCYATQDVRHAYAHAKAALFNPQYKKVILVVHSQGGIEGGLIIDWLLDELPSELLHKLEVYTFGNAANHFNNPSRAYSERHSDTQQEENAISHIEHYANSRDFVSTWGVLNFSNIPNRYMGQVFIRPGSGHQFNQHYMDTMFTSGSDHTVADSNDFMDMEVETADCKVPRESAVPSKQVLVAQNERSSSPDSTDTSHLSVLVSERQKRLKVKDLSRLWLYRNGGSPEV
ncbi:hypothetical protein ARAM_002713 [Aspergillus rambellii]|uniref:DUF676 domain-containing protein n=3 Tax=Aspergillus subgen. Nidulantes TaxID=2720870 RepID=A0A0F8VCH1_9EURO|nr:hypothetical protein ARAM_002713 [Aspergillus rambellii]